MPTYEYRCKACGHQFEVVQSFSDDSLTECDVCGAELRKVFSPVGISFKGSGFYRTDSRTGAKAASTSGAKSDGAADTKTDKKAESSGDAKPAVTPDSKSTSSAAKTA
jgi:putative FmdB family regulatory protein